jgi:hypothetical protein
MAQAIAVDVNVILPVLVSAAAPAITGFLQQYNVKFSEKAPWYLKGAVTAGIGALIGLVTSYAASGDALMASTSGAIVGAIGAFNIAFRKGSRGNLEIELQKTVVAKINDPEIQKLIAPKG